MRNFVWSDDEIQELASQFVCATEECFDLKPPEWLDWVSNPDSTRLFLKYDRNAGDLIPPGSSTAQGTYCMTADGDYLSGDFGLDNAEGTKRSLRKALANFERIAQQRGWKPRPIPRAPLERSLGKKPEPGALKFHVSSRDLPRGKDRAPGSNRNEKAAWNQNWLDLDPGEVRGLVNLERNPRPVPRAVLEKISRVAFKDNVRGQNGWKKGAFQDGTLEASLVSRKGHRALIRYTGEVKMAEGQKRYDAKLSGRAIYDESTDTFTEFQLLAVGQRHGGATYNFRKNDPGPAPMGVALELSDGQGNPSRVGRTPRI
ncbi:MAG: hypothetical protein VCG02_09890 [Verrucomicrobiota bacterium]